MGQALAGYAAALATLLAMDAVWLGFVVRDFARREFGPLMRADLMVTPAVLFYLIFATGIVVFAAVPAWRGGGLAAAAGHGALLGLVAYATYDLSNLATLNGFPPRFAVLDMAWGTVLSAVAAVAAALAGRAVRG